MSDIFVRLTPKQLAKVTYQGSVRGLMDKRPAPKAAPPPAVAAEPSVASSVSSVASTILTTLDAPSEVAVPPADTADNEPEIDYFSPLARCAGCAS